MKNKKTIGVVIILIGIFALVGFIYLMFFNEPSEELTPEEIEEQAQQEQAQVTPQQIEIAPQRAVINAGQPAEKKGVTEDELKQIASSFAERFGSYSNQSNYGNIRDLKIFMSGSMEKWAEDYIQKEIAKVKDSKIYYGMTTMAVSGEVNNFDDDVGRAEITISTQRRMATGAISNAVSLQQDIVIIFIKEQDVWKVSSATWQEVL